jgi:hypothetical protein
LVTNVSIDEIADAMVDQLEDELVPAAGPITSLKPVYSVQRYMGGEFTTPEGMKRGGAGRCPALRVRHAGTKTLRTTVARRSDRVESTFSVVALTDSHRSKDDRKSILEIAESTRHVIAARSFDLAITPMRFRSMDVIRDDEQMMALSVTFSTRHRTDYTTDPGNDTIESIEGEIWDAAAPDEDEAGIEVMGTEGTATWKYLVIAVDEDDVGTVIGPALATDEGPATLNLTNYLRLTWPAYPGAVRYRVARIESGGTPSSLGTIGSTTELSFEDIGAAGVNLNVPEIYAVEVGDTYE